MRRCICCLLALLLAPLCSLAEAGPTVPPALSELTLSELYELRKDIDARIEELQNAGARPYYESGTYRVGVDMPEGVYLLKNDGVALFPSVLVRAADDGARGDGIVSSDLVLTTAVARFVSGSFVTLTDVTAYPFDQAPAAGLDDDGAAGEGGYWVGAQIPAGYYRVLADETAPLPSYSVYDDVPGAGARLLKFEVVGEFVEVGLTDGQYISLSGCGVHWVRAEIG